MDAVAFALASAFCFGAMTVALRFSLARHRDAEAGALLTILLALVVTVPFALAGPLDLRDAWPFALTGLLGPGASQLLFTFAVRDAGPSRASVVVGSAPLFAVALALVFLDEPLRAPLVAGAVLVVAGGTLLAAERTRPQHVRLIGLVFALASTLVIAARDNVVRWLSIDGRTSPALAATATLVTGGACVAAYLRARRRGGRLTAAGFAAFAPPGLLFGLSYLFLFEAYGRGRVSIVSPLVATETLWSIALSALVLRRHELVGGRLAVGALLVVAGGATIGAFR